MITDPTRPDSSAPHVAVAEPATVRVLQTTRKKRQTQNTHHPTPGHGFADGKSLVNPKLYPIILPSGEKCGLIHISADKQVCRSQIVPRVVGGRKLVDALPVGTDKNRLTGRTAAENKGSITHLVVVLAQWKPERH